MNQTINEAGKRKQRFRKAVTTFCIATQMLSVVPFVEVAFANNKPTAESIENKERENRKQRIEAYMKKHKYEEALKEANKFIASEPDNPEAYYTRYRINKEIIGEDIYAEEIKKGYFEEIRSDLKKAISLIHPSKPKEYLFRAKLLHELATTFCAKVYSISINFNGQVKYEIRYSADLKSKSVEFYLLQDKTEIRILPKTKLKVGQTAKEGDISIKLVSIKKHGVHPRPVFEVTEGEEVVEIELKEPGASIRDEDGPMLQEALKDVEKAIVEPTAEAFILKAKIVHALYEDKQRAIAILEEAMEKYPDNPEFYFSMGSYTGNVNYFRKMAELAPNNPEILARVAESIAFSGPKGAMDWEDVVRQNKRWKEAIGYFLRAIKLDPYDKISIYHCGELYGSLGEKEKKIEITKKAVEIDPNDPQAWRHLATAYTYYNDDAAIICWNIMLELSKKKKTTADMGWALNSLVNLYNQKREYKKVVSLARKYMKKLEMGDSVRILIARGDAYFALGKYKKAISDYKKALSILPDFAEAWGAKLGIEDAKSKIKEAKEKK